MAQAETEGPSRPQRPPTGGRAWSIDVVTIDDDDADASLIFDALRSNIRVGSVRAYTDPEVALVELEKGRTHPHLILLDIQMPKMNGFAFLERLRKLCDFTNTQVVFVTTSRLSRDVMRAQTSTVCGYVIKPETYQELQLRLDNTVQQALTRLIPHANPLSQPRGGWR